MGTMFLTASILAVIFGALRNGQEVPMPNFRPSLKGATGWLNSHPLEMQGLRGKVVLIDFWTYTCINWRRTLPYVRAWAEKYKMQGLVVIGVHTPEFSFEQQFENVRHAVGQMDIDFPVATDNNYQIWDSFQNLYWPALYLIDAKGQLRYQKFGEGDYVQIEMQIQKLLKEVSPFNVPEQPVLVVPCGVELAADWSNLQSPENFLGYNRTESFATPKRFIPDRPVQYDQPSQLKLNQWALSGEWVMGKEHVRLLKGQGKVLYCFHARDLHLIMGPGTPGSAVRYRVLINGKSPGSSQGTDVDPNGNGLVTEHRMYHLVRQKEEIVDREFQIEFLDPEVEVYDFTFG